MFIIAIETMPIKELMMDYVIARLMHKMLKRKEREPQGEDARMVLRQKKCGNSFPHQSVKTYF